MRNRSAGGQEVRGRGRSAGRAYAWGLPLGARRPTEAHAVGGLAEIEQESTTESQSVWSCAGMEKRRDGDISRGGARERASSRSREYRRHQRTPRSRAGRIRSCARSLALALGAGKESAARHPAIHQTALSDDQVRERNARAVAQSARTLRRAARLAPERPPAGAAKSAMPRGSATSRLGGCRRLLLVDEGDEGLGDGGGRERAESKRPRPVEVLLEGVVDSAPA
jgi:hypothetical protein